MNIQQSRLVCFATAIALAAVQVSPAMAGLGNSMALPQGIDGDIQVSPMFVPFETESETILLAFSDGATNTIVQRISSSERECAALPSEFQADCLSQGLRGAASLASRPDYAGARTQLSAASRQISSIVQQNADPAAAPLRQGGKTYRAVKKSAVQQVNAKAAAIVAETETKLIRAAGSSAHRKTHYQRIASAVGSTKRIFRS